MNCLEFRRQHDIDPRTTERAFNEHKQRCEACAAFFARGAKLEQKLHAALKVPVPENLASRVLLKHSFEPTNRRRLVSWVSMALAASLTLALALAFHFSDRPPSLDEAVVSLINEAEHALLPNTPVDLRRIREALMPVGVELVTEIGVVTFASPCVLRGKLAGHIVLRGEKSHISVLFMPNESIDARLSFNRGESVGIVVPRGRGSIAIVGAPGEPLEAVESLVRRSLQWSA